MCSGAMVFIKNHTDTIIQECYQIYCASSRNCCRLTRISEKDFFGFPANLSADVPSYPAYRPGRYSFCEFLAAGCGLPKELFGGIFQVCRNSFVIWRL